MIVQILSPIPAIIEGMMRSESRCEGKAYLAPVLGSRLIINHPDQSA
jgi:hypothetical protein